MTRPLLLAMLGEPSKASNLSLAEWDLAVRQARETRLLARLANLLQDCDSLWRRLPEPVRRHLAAGRVLADKQETLMRWEIRCVRRALALEEAPVVLLKGAAYLAAGLPPARGRLYSDLDILVPQSGIARVEAVLARAGWRPMENLHPYDERYYRRWMHELPPLVHATRETVLDLHHTILPPTGRLHPDPAKLFQAARPLAGPGFRVLAPADMVLHCAAHLFQDGEISGGLRDLVDLDALLRHFGQCEPGFWTGLVPRARELQLHRPLFYGLRYAAQFLETPIPEAVLAESRRDRPPTLVLRAMDRLVSLALPPGTPGEPGRLVEWAAWALYVRSHWLRMPSGLLAAHLARKASRRWFEPEEPTR